MPDERVLTLDPTADLATLVDHEAAASACRTLILAYANDPTDVDWSDIQRALEQALTAFAVPDDYAMRVYDLRNR